MVHLTTPFTKGRFFARMESLSFEEKSLYSWAESLENYRLTDDVGITINIDIGLSLDVGESNIRKRSNIVLKSK